MIAGGIGIDFDNTIACYDHVFAPAAIEMGLVPAGFAGDKRAVRRAIQDSPAGDAGWMGLQGQVYGRLMERARLFEGVLDFLALCRREGVPVAVISHKTEYGHFDPYRVNLREAALLWMDGAGLFDTPHTGLSPDRVLFEATRFGKIARIAASGCRRFVDDLPELFTDPAFPPGVERHLLAPEGSTAAGPFHRHASWNAIAHAVFSQHRG
ncbi:hypothetical protein JJL56_30480 [Azospirillum sp. YIM DDC1]|uniref:Haloacid dehalogenase-like hydrolase n=1 Tax=Azospirillum aestuarii TaxID=2802052 RepID=A0ABS1I8D4_9PROT|nr:hypothetical protein [Azospirillum aestuarii]MBK4723184.1 hypothetical protein [Azospirillum aestuarii]